MDGEAENLRDFIKKLAKTETAERAFYNSLLSRDGDEGTITWKDFRHTLENFPSIKLSSANQKFLFDNLDVFCVNPCTQQTPY